MSLDAATAAEMVKGLDPKAVQELALEVAYLDAAGQHNSKQGLELVRQFCNSLQTGSDFHLKTFLKEMLENTVGREKAQNIQNQIEDLLQKRDPFINVRSADSHTIASVLGNEHPQVLAIVLSQLPARKSSEVIGLLGEGVRLSAISRMAGSESITPEAKERITQRVCKRIEAVASSAPGTIQTRPKQSLRKVAVILRNLGKELRDGLCVGLRGLSAGQSRHRRGRCPWRRGRHVHRQQRARRDLPVRRVRSQPRPGQDTKALGRALVSLHTALHHDRCRSLCAEEHAHGQCIEDKSVDRVLAD